MSREQEIRDILAPKREYTEAEHREAYIRYLMDLLQEKLFGLVYDVQHGRKATVETVEDGLKVIKRSGEPIKLPAEEAIQKLSDMLSPEDGILPNGLDWYQIALKSFFVYSFDDFKKEAEEGMHLGDCTCFPASCERCWVDSYYLTNSLLIGRREASSLAYEFSRLRNK